MSHVFWIVCPYCHLINPYNMKIINNLRADIRRAQILPIAIPITCFPKIQTGRCLSIQQPKTYLSLTKKCSVTLQKDWSKLKWHALCIHLLIICYNVGYFRMCAHALQYKRGIKDENYFSSFIISLTLEVTYLSWL